MSLQTCRECESTVSSEAASCPCCGAPYPVWAGRDEAAVSGGPEWTGLLYIGTDGYVVAIHPDDGGEVWRAPLDGGWSGPGPDDVCVLEHGGRVFAGCKGHVFCLDVHTGEVLWRNGLKGLGHSAVTLSISGQATRYAASEAGSGLGRQIAEEVGDRIGQNLAGR